MGTFPIPFEKTHKSAHRLQQGRSAVVITLGCGNFESYGMNLQDINDCYHVFEEELGAAGYDVCLYSSKNFLLNTWKDRGDTMVWLAHYTSNTDFTGDYFMWQQTSTGGMDGIDHNVDFNVLYNNQNN